jgi:maltoporin
MRRVTRIVALSGLLLAGFASSHAFAQDDAQSNDAPQDTESDTKHNTEQPKETEKPAPVLQPTATAPVQPPPFVAPSARPKVGDTTVTGYLRGGFGFNSHDGRMVCFQLALPGGLFSKYRLGNECEVWSETHFTFVTYVGDDGVVANLHFMPTVFIPTTYIGYTPTAVVISPVQFTTSTGATLSFPNLYADIKNIPWLHGGTAWAGTRYYKRESIYISDFFYWNPSGVGAGVEDINLNKDLRLSYALFAVDGEPGAPQDPTAPQLPSRTDFGLRNDLQLRGLKPIDGMELQFGFQYIANVSNNPATHGGWGVTVQWVQNLLGGDNKLAFQYGKGGGTGFGTLARFYYPDFSLRHDPSESRIRVVDVLTVQPIDLIGAQLAFVYQHDDLGTGGAGITNWLSTGGRVSVAVLRHLKLLGEVGYDHVKKENGAPVQYLLKTTGAIAISTGPQMLARPELRLFVTWANWSAAAATAGIDSGRIYTDTYADYLSGYNFGIQAETWW